MENGGRDSSWDSAWYGLGRSSEWEGKGDEEEWWIQ